MHRVVGSVFARTVNIGTPRSAVVDRPFPADFQGYDHIHKIVYRILKLDRAVEIKDSERPLLVFRQRGTEIQVCRHPGPLLLPCIMQPVLMADVVILGPLLHRS